jgi:hypothetical protein
MTIKFNKNLYNLAALKKAVKDYNEFAKFVIENSEDYFIVRINEVNQEVEAVFQDEFCNYVLGKMK